MTDAIVVYCKYLLILFTNSSTEAKSVDPDQTAPIDCCDLHLKD